MKSRSLARRSRGKKISWGLLAVGATVGAGTAMAAGHFINASANPPVTTTPKVYASNAATGAALGLALAGVGGGLMNHSGVTAIAGVLTGVLAFGGAALISSTPATGA